jgi:N-acetyl-anhydromuramyl-L-alanine amidase AmpD
MNTPTVESLKAWKESLSEGDVRAAIEHHDAVTAHILEHKDSAVIFKAAQMDPGPFVEWAKLKKTLREQLDKGPKQMQADFEEAVEQVEDLVDKIRNSETSREVIKWVGEMQNSTQGIVLNASYLEAEPTSEEIDEVAAQLDAVDDEKEKEDE